MCDRRGKSSGFGILHRAPNPVSVTKVRSAKATACASESASRLSGTALELAPSQAQPRPSIRPVPDESVTRLSILNTDD